MSHAALFPGELLGKLDLAAGNPEVWLNLGSKQLISFCHLCLEQELGAEHRERGE